MPLLILASGSPRRSELLVEAGFQFQVAEPRVTERTDLHLTARELTTWNAVRKGLTVARRYPKEVVLAADTVVSHNEKVIGKPTDLADATNILRRLSGTVHQVYSSVFIGQLASRSIRVFCEVSNVQFRKLTNPQIRDYLKKIDPLDKAGAYAAQRHGCDIIARILGSYSNVVGLPMEQTVAALEQFGIRPKSQSNRRLPSRAAPARADRAAHDAIPDRGTRR